MLIAGNWQWPQYEQAFGSALGRLGHEIIRFSFQEHFRGRLGRYQLAIPLPGPALWQLNRALTRVVRESKPDAVLVWRGTHVHPRTLCSIKAAGVRIISYNNDDPFGSIKHKEAPWHHRLLWMWYLRSLKEFDLNFVYRPVNLSEAVSYGAKNVHLLLPYFIPSQNRPLLLTEKERERFGCDLVYVGHYEPDGREKHLCALVRGGFHVRLFGGSYWTKKVLGDLAGYFGDVRPVEGDDYAKALSGARIALAFLSKLNRDTYTRRCFEIPASGRLLLTERTSDLAKLFHEDVEAVFFSSGEELVRKARWLVDHPDQINRIAEAGMKRVWADGHDVDTRAKQFVTIVSETIPT